MDKKTPAWLMVVTAPLWVPVACVVVPMWVVMLTVIAILEWLDEKVSWLG